MNRDFNQGLWERVLQYFIIFRVFKKSNFFPRPTGTENVKINQNKNQSRMTPTCEKTFTLGNKSR